MVLMVTAVPLTVRAQESDNGASISVDSVKPVNPWDGTADTDWYDKSMAEYTISTPQQLAGLAKLVNSGDTFEGKTVNLTQDIFLNGEDFAQEWISIASGGNVFDGTFNGNMHTIYNMYVSENGEGGLFGCIGEKGMVKAVVVSQGDLRAGGCIAAVNKGIIAYCDNASSVCGKDAGGICSQNDNLIYGCRNLGEVFSSNPAGIVYRNSNQLAVVSQCSNEGLVYSRHDASGIININSGWVYDCYNKGIIAASRLLYGICDSSEKVTVRDCYSVGEFKEVEDSLPISYAIGGYNYENCYALPSNADAGDAAIITKEEMQGADFVQKLNSTKKNRANAWMQDTIGINGGFPITMADYNRSIGKYKIQPEIWSEYDCKVREGDQSLYTISFYYNEQSPSVSIKDEGIARIVSDKIDGEEGQYLIEGLQPGTTSIQIHFDETENNISTDCEIKLTVTAKASEDITPVSNGWYVSDGKSYWYENGVRQGTVGRGKEIYDPDSDAWYWLDAVQGGAKAVDKDVYQESAAGPWAENADGTGKWVCYDENGHMVKGWYTNENGTYYFDLTYGTMAKGNVTIDGQNYSFDTVTGILQGAVPQNGWYIVGDNWYWYENGVKQGTEGRGKEIYDPDSDAWYWLDAVDGGKKATNKDLYQESAAGPWAENEDGTGKWVRYDENGHMVKGWYSNENGTYYFDYTYGTMAKGNREIDGQDYYFDEVTGILK